MRPTAKPTPRTPRLTITVMMAALAVFARAAGLPPEGGSDSHHFAPVASSSTRKSDTGNKQTSLSSVRIESPDHDGSIDVIVEANGALPEPTGEALLNPPRIYLDFADVLPLRVVEPSPPDSLVARVRVAEHSASPLVTRVVVDLIKEVQYRVDSSARQHGRVVVMIGMPRDGEPRSATAPLGRSQPRVANGTTETSGRPAATGHQPSGNSPRSTSLRSGTASAETQYRMHVSPALVRLGALRRVLEAIDRRAESVPGDLDAAAKEFDDVATLLAAIKPPSSRTSTHALLVRSCTLGARAVRLRQSPTWGQDAAGGWEAASAAAGALLMLERANGELK